MVAEARGLRPVDAVAASGSANWRRQHGRLSPSPSPSVCPSPCRSRCRGRGRSRRPGLRRPVGRAGRSRRCLGLWAAAAFSAAACAAAALSSRRCFRCRACCRGGRLLRGKVGPDGVDRGLDALVALEGHLAAGGGSVQAGQQPVKELQGPGGVVGGSSLADGQDLGLQLRGGVAVQLGCGGAAAGQRPGQQHAGQESCGRPVAGTGAALPDGSRPDGSRMAHGSTLFCRSFR